jgi:2-(1,2-epoxy-1,2-dihydrophenyl)acetyl-CoA isomerase
MTWLLPRVVGLGRAMHLTLDAEPFEADEAERIGLVSRVVASDALLPEAEAFAHKVAAYPRVGVEWTKRGFHRSLESTFAEATERELEAEVAGFRSPETRARLRAFAERKRE